MSPLLVVGESLVDVTVGEGQEPTTRPGGSPLNIAVGCARLDVPTVLATQVGDDQPGELLREHLDDADVDVRSLPPHHSDTSVARAYLDGSGHATYEFELDWDPTELPLPEGNSCVHVGSIGASLQPGADAVHGLAVSAHRDGVPVSFDPNVRTAITPDVNFLRRRATELSAVSSVVKLSDEDADVLFPDDTDVLGTLVGRGMTRLAVMTCGGRSVRLRSRLAAVEVTPPPVTVVDTIGAGDSFMSALLAVLIERELLGNDLTAAQLQRVGVYAARAAALTCTRIGADPPTRAELGKPPTP